jgi:CO/xanthine dehydrogenase Mo-binding subunit
LDAKDKVIGKALYPGDINRPNQAMAKILFAGRPHARITRLDSTKAESMPGVIAVFTAKDVPVNEYGLIMPDQPVLCGPGSSKADADHVRFVGDQVALVVAETETQAEAAVKEIEVEYEDLPVLTDPLQAREEGAFQIHPDREHNIFCEYHIRHGDVASGFEQADIIVEGEYRTPAQEHAFLQPEAGLAYIDEQGRVSGPTRTESRSPMHWISPTKTSGSSIPPSAVLSAGGRTCRSRSCSRWLRGDFTRRASNDR